MKKIILLFCLLIYAVFCFSQDQPSPTTCPTISFSYDASGNRTHRNLVLVDCSQLHRQRDTTGNPVVSNFPIKVYPNPAQDKINIEIPQDSLVTESAVLLIDLSGKTVYSGLSSSLQMQIDVSELAEGTYLLKITRGKKNATFNVLKNK